MIAHFLFGDVAGQLLVLRRKSCQLIAGEGFRADGFDAFDEGFQNSGTEMARQEMQLPSAAVATPCWLKAFFDVRPRGVLRVNVPITVGGHQRSLTVMNTHMPHDCDNTELLWQLGKCVSDLADHSNVLLAGDFNPLPEVSISAQFAPLSTFGILATHDSECRTWDLNQSLTRQNACTPRSMQLDFIFLQRQRLPRQPALFQKQHSSEHPDHLHGKQKTPLTGGPLMEEQREASPGMLNMEVLRTAMVNTSSFFISGAPLSDHYGLASEIRFV